MAVGSWLFVDKSRSTWIERPQRNVLRIAGPGAARDLRQFATDDELEEFLTSLAERLVAEGWILWHVDYDRRRAVRRRRPRSSPDRRAES